MSTNTNKYRCLETRVVQDEFAGTKDETKFVAGKDYPLTDESYARWERRGVFGPIPEKKKRRRRKKDEAAAGGDSNGQAADAGDNQADAGKRAESASAAPSAGAVMGTAG